MYKSLIRNKKTQNVENLDGNLQFFCQDYQKGLFVLFVKPYAIQIRRSLEDLVWLRNYLNVEFPFYFLPPVECGSNQIQFIQNFMDRICDREYIQNSKVIEIFVNDEKFKKIEEKQMPYLNDYMLNKINTMFSINENKQMLQTQEDFYDQYFSTVIGKYAEQKNEMKYFLELFKNFSKQSNLNRIQYQKLRELSQNLSQIFKNAGQTIYQISFILKMIQESNNINHKNIQFAQEEKIQFTNHKLIVGMEHWGAQMMSQSFYVTQNMTEFFKYRQHEEIQLQDLLDLRIGDIREAFERLQDTQAKKKKVWESKDIGQWQIDGKLDDYYEYLSNFEIAEKIILPDETYIMEDLKKQNLFINKHVMYEFLNYIENTNYYLNQNFQDFNDKVKKDFKSEDVLWNIFDSENQAIVKKDYTFNLITGR